MSYHFHIGRALSSASLANSAYSRVPWSRGAKLKSRQKRTMFDRLLPDILQVVARPSRALALPGVTTSFPGASSKPRFLLGMSSATCLPFGIPARIQRRQFRAHMRNIGINIGKLRPACSFSLGDSGRWLPCCYAVPLPGPAEATQSTQNCCLGHQSLKSITLW